MRRRTKLGLALGVLLAGGVGFVAAPIAYVETACRGTPAGDDRRPIIADPAWQRPEARTFLTYPEWHMVYAYEDFATTLEKGDEHGFDFLSSVGSFWSSYCDLNRMADAHGGADWPTRQMIYTIGTSFDVEMAAKALYEETLGRLAAWLRGPEKTPQDRIAAEMARDYAAFLHQTPWYRFPFAEWTQRLDAAPTTGGLRSWERRLALGAEWRAKQAYARLIAGAVAATGQDELRIRSVVRGLSPERLAALPGVTVVGPAGEGEGTIVESDRYAAFTAVLKAIAAAGGEIAEIAGNDDIMVSLLEPPSAPAPAAGQRVLHAFAPRSDGTVRRLVLVKVADLAALLRAEGRDADRVEHVFDY